MNRAEVAARAAGPLLWLALFASTWTAGSRTSVTYDAGSGAVVEWTQYGRCTPLATAGVTWVALLAWSRRSAAVVRPRTWTVVAALIPAVAAWNAGGLNGFGDIDLGGTVVAPDGRSYRAAAGFWSAAIVRVDASDWQATTMKIVAEARTDSPRRYATLVSPRDHVTADLVATSDGLLLWTNGARCYVAYDVVGHTALDREALSAVSPFAALSAHERGNDKELEALIAEVARARTAGIGEIESVLPSDSVIARHLTSANPWVREAARRIAEAGGASLYPLSLRTR